MAKVAHSRLATARHGAGTTSYSVPAILAVGQLRTAGAQLLAVVFLILVWWFVSTLPSAIHIPSPAEAARSAVQLEPDVFLKDALLSTWRVTFGFIIAAVIAIPLGVTIGYSPLVRDLIFFPIELFRPIPPIAWIPLAILFFPGAEWMIVFLTFYGAFFPIVYNTVVGVSGIRSNYIRAAKSLGASEWTIFWDVVLPAALPTIFTGLYIAISVAWLMVVAGEMIANQGGIGAMTWQAYQTTQYPRIFVGMAAIGVLGYLSSLAVRLIARIIVRWE